jgi:transcriptional regulator with XRE-family HTH domain
VGKACLPGKTADRLKKALSALRLNQADLAERIGMSQPWVSKVLLGKVVRDVEACERLVREVRRAVDEQISRGLIEETRIPEIRQTLRLLETALGPRAMFAPPGGAIPSDAENFVMRPVITDALSCLDSIPFSMCVTGPADSGKTTVLAALTREAGTHGIQVSFVDCKAALKGELERLQEDRSTAGFPGRESVLATGILRAALDGWGVPAPGDRVKDSLDAVDALGTRLRASGPGREPGGHLLILDGITDTARGHPEYAADLLRMIRVLHNSRATHGLNLSLAVSLSWTSHLFYSHIRESSALAIFHPVLEAGWFSHDEVAVLLRHMGDDASAHLNALMDHYGGAPLVTHIAATRILEQNTDPDVVFEEAKLGKGQFAFHVREVSRLLEEATSEARQILLTVSENQVPQISLFSEHREFLINAHLVCEDDEGHLRVPSELYRWLIKTTLQ